MSATAQKHGQSLNEKSTAEANTAESQIKSPRDGKTKQSDSDPQSGTHDDGKTDVHGWEVVENQEPKEEIDSSPDGTTTRAHFQINVGWGRWKHKLFSYDYTKTVHYHDPEDDDDDDDDDDNDEEDHEDSKHINEKQTGGKA